MSSWRYGQINGKSRRMLRHFTPIEICERITQVDIQRLWDGGKRLILLDVDNTVVGWHSEEFDPEIVAWIERAREKGFHLCIISNTRRPERLARIAKHLQVDFLRGRFKPSRRMYFAALAKFKVPAAAAVMIGDQVMTDLLGARRSGIDAILLKPLDKLEFFGTKFNRMLESILRPHLFKMIDVAADSPIADKKGMHQFVRFCLVGGVSFVIDASLTYIFMKRISVGGHLMSETVGNNLISAFPVLTNYFKTPTNAAAPILGGLASFIAMFNSFVMNRKWTFAAVGQHPTITQVHRFYTIAISGAVLNAILFSVFLNMMGALHEGALLAAKVIATVFVAFWNFFGQRNYTFRAPKPDQAA